MGMRAGATHVLLDQRLLSRAHPVPPVLMHAHNSKPMPGTIASRAGHAA